MTRDKLLYMFIYNQLSGAKHDLKMPVDAPLTDQKRSTEGASQTPVAGVVPPYSLLVEVLYRAQARHETHREVSTDMRILLPKVGDWKNNAEAPGDSHLRRIGASGDRDQRPIGKLNAGAPAHEQGAKGRDAGNRRPDQRGAAPQQRGAAAVAAGRVADAGRVRLCGMRDDVAEVDAIVAELVSQGWESDEAWIAACQTVEGWP